MLPTPGQLLLVSQPRYTIYLGEVEVVSQQGKIALKGINLQSGCQGLVDLVTSPGVLNLFGSGITSFSILLRPELFYAVCRINTEFSRASSISLQFTRISRVNSVFRATCKVNLQPVE